MSDPDDDFFFGYLVGSADPSPRGPRSFMGALVALATLGCVIAWLVTR